MAHRVAVYAVRARQKRHVDEFRNLGDYDESGGWLGDTLERYLDGMAVPEQGDEQKPRRQQHIELSTRYLVGADATDVIAAALSTNEHGVASTFRRGRQRVFDRRRRDVEEMKAFVSLVLPRRRKIGFMAVHIPFGRSVKGPLDRWLHQRFEHDHSDLVLSIEPLVPADYLRKAARENRIKKARLVAYSGVSADNYDDRAKWGDPEILGDLEVVIPARRFHFLSGQPILDALDEPDRLHDLLIFEGVQFDDLKIEVVDGNRVKTVTLSQPDRGHAVTYDVDDELEFDDETEEPTDDSLLDACLSSVDSATST